MRLNNIDKKFYIFLAIIGVLTMASSELISVNEYKFQHYFVFIAGIILSISSISTILFHER